MVQKLQNSQKRNTRLNRSGLGITAFFAMFTLLSFIGSITNRAKACYINISASASTICAGSSVTFTGTITSAVSYTNYQWKKNGVAMTGTGNNGTFSAPGNGTFTFTVNGLSDGDVITCYITEPAYSYSTTSSGITINVSNQLSSNFTDFNSVSSGNYLWFSSVVHISGSATYPLTIYFKNQSISSADFSTLYPADAELILSSVYSTATTTFDGTKWVTTAPPGASGNYFMSGYAYHLTSSFTGANPTWSGTMLCSETGVTINWQWADASYTSFTSSLNSVGVKPSDCNSCSSYSNSDHGGTPENYKSYLTSGGSGGGGSNYTGSYSSTSTINNIACTNVTPSVSISASPGSTVCSGTSVTFTATPTHGGTTPAYQWVLNGTNVGTNSPTYSSSSLTNGNTISCILTSSDTTAAPASVASNTVSMTVSSVPSITSTTPGSACGAGSVTLGATASAGTVNWYTASTGGSSIATGTSYATSSISSTTTYYAGATNGSCTSASRTAVVATVNAVPSSITGTTTITSGATTTLSDATTGGIWTSSNTSVATVGSLTGVVSGVAAGSCNITYTVGGCSVYTSVTVVSVAPITGTTTFCAGTSSTLADATSGGVWTSSNTSVATVGSASGTVTGVAAGTATVSYTAYGFSVTTVVTITGPVAITGGTVVGAGGTLVLTDATSGGLWTSSNTSVAIVCSGCGHVTGASAGAVNITYTIGSCFVSTPISVISIPAISGAASVCTGSSTTFSDAVTGGTWTSTNPYVAAVGTTSGVVTGIGAGVTTISYYIDGAVVTKSITVYSTPTAIGGLTTVGITGTSTLTDAVTGGVWTSSSSVATVGSATGIVTGVSSGSCVISYNNGGCYATAAFTVLPIYAITGTTAICAGTTSTLADATSGGTWSSSNTSMATINSTSGLVTGVAAGLTVISYYASGHSIATTVTVNAAPTVGAIAGYTSVAVGGTISLSDFSAGGGAPTWTSSNSSIASVNTTGVVTGVSAGAAIITYSVSNSCGTTMATITISVFTGITGSDVVCTGGTANLSGAISGGTWTSGNTARATVNATTGVVTGVSAGTVTISYNNSGSISTSNVTVLPIPSITGTTTDLTCHGYANGSVNISVTGGSTSGTWLYYTYSWSNGATTNGAWGLPAGIYSVSATDPNGCSGTASFVVNQPSAIKDSAYVTDSVLGCGSGAINLMVSGGTGAYTYTWNNGVTTQDVSGLLEGAYWVTITDANSCQNTGWYYVNPCLSCYENGERRASSNAVVSISGVDLDVKVFPNPFSTNAKITFSTPVDGHTTVDIINALNGEKVATIFDELTNTGTQHTCTLNGESLASGIYLYRISSANVSYTGKVVLAK